ncbi:MAG: site-2 protease family protein [Candidatus Nealsonbacteria bacterium]|nr:site-2 protease family protein [Candidatus Nealsonbacteria bacterium]
MEIIFILIVLFFSIVIHEVAHGSMAYHLGDSTAKHSGRLSLNPLKHIDFFGTILLPLFLILMTQGRGPIFGWAKPVPVNPYNFQDQKWGMLKVAIAGPAVNFLIALIFGFSIRFLNLPQPFLFFFSIIVIYNFLWGIFNLIPLPPLDGSHILFTFLPEKFSEIKLFLQQYGFFILIFFIFFGLGRIFQGAILLYYLITGQPFII